VATIVNGAVHFIGIGVTNITASQPVLGNLPAITSPAVVLTVTQPAITLAATKTITLPSADVDPAATSTIPTATYPVVYASSNPAVATIVSGLIHPISAGVTIITASEPVPANATFSTPASATMVLTVAQTTGIFTFLPFSAPKTVGVADFSPATSTGDPIVYTSSDNTVATVVNGLVHLVGSGTVNITATLVPSGNYFNAAPSSITQQLNVVSGIQQILLYYPASQTTAPAAVPVLIKGTGVYQTNILSCSGASIPTGLPLTMVSADTTIVKVVGQGLLPVHVGFTAVTFSQTGNSTYAAATPVIVYVQVSDPSYAPVIVHQALSPNGDGTNDFLFLEGLQDHANNHVVIADRNGAKVYEADNYNNKDVVFKGKSSHNGQNLPGGTYFYLIDYPDGASHAKLTGYFVLKY
jgi:gliding motility-associated-like protein